MPSTKPRNKVAIAFARHFASALIKNTEPVWQQEGSTLSDAEMEIVSQELLRISKRIAESINQDALALAQATK